jgi:hypothetical protein
MSSGWKRFWSVVAVGVLIASSAAQSVSASAPQRTSRSVAPGRPANLALESRLTATRPEIKNNFNVLGHLNLGDKTKGDIYLFDHGEEVGRYAYVGSWAIPCNGRGVHIVNINRPHKPKKVAMARYGNDGVWYEDVVVMPIGDRTVLGASVQQCEKGGVGGFALFDVTDPKHPKRLSFTTTAAGGNHEMDMVVRSDGTALAALAVPFGEVSGGDDLVILDITHPKKPTKLAGWGIIGDSSLPIPSAQDPPIPMPEITTCCQGIGYVADFFFHSARFADGGVTMYASHWDAGILKFDVSDPANPVVVGHTIYPFDADGDAHSLTSYDLEGKRYILQNDEDFQALSPLHLSSNATSVSRFAAIEMPWMPTLLTEVGTVNGTLMDAGDGCDVGDYSGAEGEIVMFDAPLPSESPCKLTGQILKAADAGAAAIIINFVGENRPSEFFSPGSKGIDKINDRAEGIPAIGIAPIDGFAEAHRPPPLGPATVMLEPQNPSWGFLRIYEETTDDADDDGIADYEQVGQFSNLPHVQGEFPPSKGFWSIHNTEVNLNRAYSSWYSHGIVALDLSNPISPTLVGQFTPGGKGVIADMWGVAVDRETGFIYGSDIGSGLWILEPTGDAVPTAP